MPRFLTIVLAAATLATAGLTPLAPAQSLPTERVLPAALAEEGAAAAVAACTKDGYRVSAAVVDQAGVVRALLRGDGAGPHTLDSSTRKAYTAATFRASTTRMTEIVNTNPAAVGLRNVDRLLFLGGGLPITAGAETIGAIGVGGSPGGDKDEACAQAGIDKIKDRLR